MPSGLSHGPHPRDVTLPPPRHQLRPQALPAPSRPPHPHPGWVPCGRVHAVPAVYRGPRPGCSLPAPGPPTSQGHPAACRGGSVPDTLCSGRMSLPLKTCVSPPRAAPSVGCGEEVAPGTGVMLLGAEGLPYLPRSPPTSGLLRNRCKRYLRNPCVCFRYGSLQACRNPPPTPLGGSWEVPRGRGRLVPPARLRDSPCRGTAGRGEGSEGDKVGRRGWAAKPTVSVSRSHRQGQARSVQRCLRRVHTVGRAGGPRSEPLTPGSPGMEGVWAGGCWSPAHWIRKSPLPVSTPPPGWGEGDHGPLSPWG